MYCSVTFCRYNSNGCCKHRKPRRILRTSNVAAKPGPFICELVAKVECRSYKPRRR